MSIWIWGRYNFLSHPACSLFGHHAPPFFVIPHGAKRRCGITPKREELFPMESTVTKNNMIPHRACPGLDPGCGMTGVIYVDKTAFNR
jgi:hypothetical protein